MPVVFFDTNALYIDGYRDSFTAGSLAADYTPIGVGVRVLHGSDYLVNDIWSNYASPDGSTFSSRDEVMAYLTTQFAMRRLVGETFGVATVAGTDLVQGQPVAVSRVSGQLFPARADTYVLGFVAGLASTDTAKGFTTQPAHGAVTLPNWTVQAGAPTLLVGQPYFLGRSGGLATVPDFTVACVAQIGTAIAPLTLSVDPTAPILL